MLLAARLRHVAGTRWGSPPYLDMERLREKEQEEQPTQIDEPLPPDLVPPRGNQLSLPLTTNSKTKCAHLDRHYAPLSWRAHLSQCVPWRPRRQGHDLQVVG